MKDRPITGSSRFRIKDNASLKDYSEMISCRAQFWIAHVHAIPMHVCVCMYACLFRLPSPIWLIRSITWSSLQWYLSIQAENLIFRSCCLLLLWLVFFVSPLLVFPWFFNSFFIILLSSFTPFLELLGFPTQLEICVKNDDITTPVPQVFLAFSLLSHSFHHFIFPSLSLLLLLFF